jgi:cytidine deaminase
LSTDWPALRAAAIAAVGRAYAPYSGLRVGAAGLTDDGRIIVGSNVENASFGLTLCAECSLVSALHGAGPAVRGPAVPGAAVPGADAGNDPDAASRTGPAPGASLVAVAVVAGDGQPLLPCGRCRQLLLEAGGAGLLVEGPDGPVELNVLLPAAFTTTDLAERREPR